MDKKEDMTIHDDLGEKPEVVGRTKEMNTTSAALAAAIAAEPPRLLSAGMIKLYAIMSVGYLVSTMNGFGTSLLLFFLLIAPTPCEFNLHLTIWYSFYRR